MYSLYFEKKSNLPKLTEKNKGNNKFNHLRPVYSQELNLYGFNKHWDYPESTKPILWANDNKYYYCGELVAEVKSNDSISKPSLVVYHTGKIEEINLSKLIEKNIDRLITLENEAKQFIFEIYNNNKKSHMAISFSGGKDSQAILELITQVIPPDEYTVCYNDTGMELPYIQSTIEDTIRKYKNLYKNFDIEICKPVNEITKLWKDFGPPTRRHRWCCTVCKTAPFTSFIKNKFGDERVFNFVGIRSDESSARSSYNRYNSNGKHHGIASVHPIFYWSSFEVYLYLFYKNIDLNLGYKHGLSRVGCSVCPFSTPSSEYINSFLFPDHVQKFNEIIDSALLKEGVQTSERNKYIKNKDWAKLVRNYSITDFQGKYSFIDDKDDLIIKSNIQINDIIFGLSIFNKFNYNENNDYFYFEFILDDIIIRGNIEIKQDVTLLSIQDKANDIRLKGYLKRIFNRLIYCVKCGSCEIECPTGALDIRNKRIDTKLCTNCLKCIMVYDNGCLNAKYRINLKGDKDMVKKSLNRYWGFGILEEWVLDFISNPNDWLFNNQLGPIQFKAMKNWLKDSELLDEKLKVTEFYEAIKGKDKDLIFSLMWINLLKNSEICIWFSSLAYSHYKRNTIDDILQTGYPNIGKRGRDNALLALFKTLTATPLASYFKIVDNVQTKGRSIVSFDIKEVTNVSSLSILYTLFIYAETTNNYNFTLDQIINDNNLSFCKFAIGTSSDFLTKVLISLESNKNKFVRVEFSANLDNIFLNKNFTSVDVLKYYF